MNFWHTVVVSTTEATIEAAVLGSHSDAECKKHDGQDQKNRDASHFWCVSMMNGTHSARVDLYPAAILTRRTLRNTNCESFQQAMVGPLYRQPV